MTINTPGVNVLVQSSVTPQVPPTATDTAFVVGISQMGRTDKPVLIRSLQDYISNFGNRQSWDTLYDWLDAFFNEAGGGSVYVQRVVGAAATYDSHTFNDSGAVASITVQSIGQGASGLSAAIQSGVSAGSFNIVVTGLPDGSTLTSPDLVTVQDAVNWGANQKLITVIAAGANPPANIAATALSGGNDQRASITDVQRTAALALIPKGLGPGQVVVPGATTETMYAALFNHAYANNRFTLCDLVDTGSVTTLTSALTTLQADATITTGALGSGMMCADWQKIPGLTPTSTRTVPPTAIVAALIARLDRASGNPNLAASGANGQVQYAIGRTQPDWTDAQITQLVAAGVMPFATIYGGERFYGYRTPLNPSLNPVMVMASAARLVMAIKDAGSKIGQNVLGDEIDGQQHEQAKYGGLLSGMLLGYYRLGALYGATSSDAYVVDVGPDVNTPATIANRELHAAVGIRPSPFAETVYFQIAVTPVTSPV